MQQVASDKVAEAEVSDASIWAPTSDSRATPTDLVIEALRKRPKFSIRMQIYLAVAFSLIIICGVGMSLLVTTYMIESKVRFLEISNSYLFEMQQARRFEKNYFLYGTNLSEALENVSTAKQILLDNAKGLEEMMGKESFSHILPRLEHYESSLRELQQISHGPHNNDYSSKKKEVEAVVRRHGQKAVSLAEQLMQKEKAALDKMILLSRKVHIYSFLFLFLFFAFNTYFLGRRVLRPLWRFVSYAERIATGDYSPITPARRYRDEFSNLAVAINKMIREIEVKQDQLIQSHKVAAIGLLTSGIAHDLNNPINNINITAEYILENFDELSSEEKKRLLGEIMQQGDRSSSTVKELLHFTRAKPEALEKLRITNVIDDTLKLLQNQLNLNKIIVQKHYPELVPPVGGNRDNLQQVFLNLFTNAMQAMVGGGVLRIVVDDTHVGLLKIDIIDTGVGIEPDNLQKIFDPYFTTKGITEGTGLGLSVCFGIIKKHGGNILASSEVGKGSTFSLFLPYSSHETTESTQSSETRGEKVT